MLYATTVQGNDFAPNAGYGVIWSGQFTTVNHWLISAAVRDATLRRRGLGTAKPFTGDWTDGNSKQVPMRFKSVVVISLGIPILLMAPMLPPRR